ncbi:hypothetical protein HOLleu_28230 [Holothuria leucospilota]|uniref:Uncharacterized protein n=1 Tax=Holothuria leucospilota TaxID=206669 RepID=A0A9Q1H1B5_HOLLE|nr:hypothetical protein HOLleu_28230 [Holothuria leucospilota]
MAYLLTEAGGVVLTPMDVELGGKTSLCGILLNRIFGPTHVTGRAVPYTNCNYRSSLNVTTPTTLSVVAIYRPPYSAPHPVNANIFLTEFAGFINTILVDYKNVLTGGDFNIHVDVENDTDKSFLVIFFISKIQRLRDSMDGEELYIPPVHAGSLFTDSESCLGKSVYKIVSNLKSTTCVSDPLPTKYVKSNKDILLPLMTKIVDSSLRMGEFSSL